MTRFTVSAPVFPTEDAELVACAVRNLFPEAAMSGGDGMVKGESSEVTHLLELITEQKIRFAFLEEVARNVHGTHFSVELNKQAATAGRVNIVDEPRPLGCILLEGEVEQPVLFFEKMLNAEGYISSRHNTFSG